MTKEEAKDCQIEERDRRSYFSAYAGKSNLTKPPEDRWWYKIVTVELEQGGFADEVGVVTIFEYPRLEPLKVTEDVIDRACEKIKAGGPWRYSALSTKEPWVGIPLAEAFGCNLSEPQRRKQLKKIVDEWIKEGILTRRKGGDGNRDPRPYVEVSKGRKPAHRRGTRDAMPPQSDKCGGPMGDG